MKRDLLLSVVLGIALLFTACEKEQKQADATLSADELSLVSDEVIAELTFAELLDDGDDGTFWEDAVALQTKSATIEPGTCPYRTVLMEPNKITIKLEFSGDDCEKSGTVITEIIKPTADNGFIRKKTITFVDFINHGATMNGTRTIEQAQTYHSISGTTEIDRTNDKGEAIHFVRTYSRTVEWLCGLDTRLQREDNIRTVSGSEEVTRSVNGEAKSYSKAITSPLLLVAACDMKIQAGQVEINRPNGTEITINYGPMPDVDCDADFDCKNTFEVTKNGTTFQVELIEGKRVRVVDSE